MAKSEEELEIRMVCVHVKCGCGCSEAFWSHWENTQLGTGNEEVGPEDVENWIETFLSPTF